MERRKWKRWKVGGERWKEDGKGGKEEDMKTYANGRDEWSRQVKRGIVYTLTSYAPKLFRLVPCGVPPSLPPSNHPRHGAAGSQWGVHGQSLRVERPCVRVLTAGGTLRGEEEEEGRGRDDKVGEKGDTPA